MDWLGRRGGLFLHWASDAFGDGECRGSEELSEDNSPSADRSMSSSTTASIRVYRRLLSSRNQFTCSRNSTTCLAGSSCLASISWSQRRNWSSGGWFAGLLDMTLSSDGPMGCSRMAKASEIERSPGSGCTQALEYRLSDFLLGVFHRRLQL